MDNNKIPKLRIAMLFHGYYPHDVRVRREAETLAEAGHSVEVVCLRASKKQGQERETRQDKVNNVYIHRLPIERKRGNLLRYIYEYLGLIILGSWKLSRLHIKKRFHIVHIHNMPDILILTGLLAKWMGAKLVLDVHDPMAELYISTSLDKRNGWVLKLLKWQEKFSYRLADQIISVNETMREILASKGISPEDILILHNFPDTKYLPIRNDINRWPRHDTGFILLYAGTVTRHYRLDVAVEALAIAKKRIPDLRLRILGDGNELNLVMELASKIGVRDRVEHLEPVNIDMISEILLDADVGISTHQGGIFGNLYYATKIFDYLTQGLPVVSSRTETVRKYIPEEAIFYFEPEDPEDMASQIVKMQQNPELVRSKMDNAKKFMNRYTWQAEKHKLLDLYNELLG